MTSPFGFVIIDKPSGITSHDCVKRIRKIFGIRRVGHGGTLDPEVTGVLPIAIGNATRLLPYLPSSKTYNGIIQLGIQTNTDDLQGEIIKKGPWPKLDESSLNKILDKFRGKTNQVPPLFSSVHFQGERSYKKARRGDSFSLPSKEINLFNLEVLNWNQAKGEINLSIHCSSGTYIRSLARDIGNLIGCGGSLSKLRRLKALGFDENEAQSLHILEENQESKDLKVINPTNSLSHLPCVKLIDEKEILYWQTGRKINIPENRIREGQTSIADKDIPKRHVLIKNSDGEIEGIGLHIGANNIQPKVVLKGLG